MHIFLILEFQDTDHLTLITFADKYIGKIRVIEIRCIFIITTSTFHFISKSLC